jgi:hypothetical protein
MRRFALVAIIGVVITACSVLPLANQTTVTPTVIQALSTFTPLIVESETPSQQNIPTYMKDCLEPKISIPTGFLAEGKIIINNYSFSDIDRLEAISSGSTINSILFNKAPLFASVSTDGRLLAFSVLQQGYVNQPTTSVEILSVDGTLINLLPEKDEWGGMLYWLDDSNLVFTKNDAMNIINVISGAETHLDYSSPEYSTYIHTLPVYDPSLTRVIFQQVGVFNQIDLVLRNLQTGEDLWRRQNIGAALWYLQPSWSPDGQKVVIGLFSPPLLVILDKDGQHEQEILLPSSGGYVELYQTTWSPNQRYIAFWLGGSLTVFDTRSQTLIDYCLPPSDALNSHIYWSPNSQQIVINIANVSDQEPGRIVAVDIPTGRAIQNRISLYCCRMDDNFPVKMGLFVCQIFYNRW